jgi:hypothetical protein
VQTLMMGIALAVRDGITYLKATRIAGPRQATFRTPKQVVHLVLMSRGTAENLWTIDGADGLLITTAQYFSNQRRVYLRSDGDPAFSFGILGRQQKPVEANAEIHAADGELFVGYTARLHALELHANVAQLSHAESPTKELRTAQNGQVPFAPPLAPEDADFARAAIWQIGIPQSSSDELSDVSLELSYHGDVARLYHAGCLLDDNVWNCQPSRVGLKDLVPLDATTLEIRILPHPSDSQIV